VLTLFADRVECLWEEALPVEVKQLPEDLAALDRVLSDRALMGPILERFRRELLETGRRVLDEGRPTIAMETLVWLMVLKARYRWGYRTLVAEVSDSIVLRRFCRISLVERVPDESTVRKLTRRLGPDTVSNLTRMLISKATRERRFRPRAVRIDSTVVEATSSIRRTRTWRRTGCGRWSGRGASSRSGLERPSGGCGIARGRSAGGCGGSPARSGLAREKPRRRCSSSRGRPGSCWSARSPKRAGSSWWPAARRGAVGRRRS
jgi:hypothetical protein